MLVLVLVLVGWEIVLLVLLVLVVWQVWLHVLVHGLLFHEASQ